MQQNCDLFKSGNFPFERISTFNQHSGLFFLFHADILDVPLNLLWCCDIDPSLIEPHIHCKEEEHKKLPVHVRLVESNQFRATSTEDVSQSFLLASH